MQIRSQLTLRFALLVTTILLVAFISLYLFAKKSSEDEFHKRLTDKANTSGILLLKVDKVDSSLLKTIDLSKHDVLFRENISIFNSQNKEIYTNNDTIVFDAPPELLTRIRQNGMQKFSQGEFDIVGIPFNEPEKSYESWQAL